MAALPEKRVYLFDTDGGRRDALRVVLRDVNYRTEAFGRFEEGVLAVQKSAPDLLLVVFPDAKGASEALKPLRKALGSKKVPIVAIGAAPPKPGDVEGHVARDAPAEDVLDWVEKLIGLPPPPEGKKAAFDGKESAEIVEMRREMESLQEQLHFYQTQLDQVSVAGEREARDMGQLLHELQDNLDKTGKDRDQIREELKLVRADLAKKDREVSEREKTIGDVRTDLAREKTQLEQEVAELRKTMDESRELHKKAQNALREYYKAKMEKQAKTEATARQMEAELKDTALQLVEAQRDLQTRLKETQSAKAELEAERGKAKKAREALAQLSKTFE